MALSTMFAKACIMLLVAVATAQDREVCATSPEGCQANIQADPSTLLQTRAKIVEDIEDTSDTSEEQAETGPPQPITEPLLKRGGGVEGFSETIDPDSLTAFFLEGSGAESKSAEESDHEDMQVGQHAMDEDPSDGVEEPAPTMLPPATSPPSDLDKLGPAEPLGWEHGGSNEDPTEAGHVNLHFHEIGCLALSDDDNATIGDIDQTRDLACLTSQGLSGWSKPCRSGFPFYRMTATDLGPHMCKMFCLDKGFDVSALIHGTAGKLECRCTASAENVGVWGSHSAPDWVDKFQHSNDTDCKVLASKYVGGLIDGSVPEPLLHDTDVDDLYEYSLVTGDTPDVDEDPNVPPVDAKNLSRPSLVDEETVAGACKTLKVDDSSKLPNCGGGGVAADTCNCDPAKGEMRVKCGDGAGHVCAWGPAVPETWPKGEVKYYLHSSLNAVRRTNLAKAMASVRAEFPCVTWTEISTQRSDGAYLYIQDQNSQLAASPAHDRRRRGCNVMNSGYRRRGNAGNYLPFVNSAGHHVYYYQGPTILNIGPDFCTKTHKLIHELGHVLSMMHTQKRQDAQVQWADPWTGAKHGPFLNIHWQNIESSAWSQYKPNYFQYEGSGNDYAPFEDGGRRDPIKAGYAPYDYDSIMHYGDTYFLNTGGRRRFAFRTGRGDALDAKLGEGLILSAGDVMELADMYRCDTDELWIAQKERQANNLISWVHYKESGFSGYGKTHGDTCIVMSGADGAIAPQSWAKTTPNNRGDVSTMIRGHYAASMRINLVRYLPRTKQWLVVADKRLTTATNSPAQKVDYHSSSSAMEAWIKREHEKCHEYLVDSRGYGYRGCQTKTRSGRTCQKWTSQSPHSHSRTPGNYPGKGLGNHNHCRNPDGESTIWCYTTSSSKRWEFCSPRAETGGIITDLSYGNGVYYSVSTSITLQQRCWWGSWSWMKSKIAQDWKENYRITFLDKLNGKWYNCNTLATGIGAQTWGMYNSNSQIDAWIAGKYRQYYRIQILVELPDTGGYLAVMSKQGNTRPEFAPSYYKTQSVTWDRAYGPVTP